MKVFNPFLKRCFDICFSLFCLAVSLPLWVLIPLLIYAEDGLPVLFCDTRVGRNGKAYRHLKFRSMNKGAEDAVGPVWASKDDARITNTGRILRATAMDEMPQLINILKGEMSFVGPRPERGYFVEIFSKQIPQYGQRLSVRPGLTGLAQIYGKYNTLPGKKLEYDLRYIKEMNFLLDLKLIFLSFLITFKSGWTRFEDRNP